jgi:hypothetical protein
MAMAVGGMIGGGIFSVLGVAITLAGHLAFGCFVLGGVVAAVTAHSYAGVMARSGRSGGVTWDIEPVGDSCRLTVTHDQLRDRANDELYGGWPMILSGLKTWLETGELLTTPGPLMYS